MNLRSHWLPQPTGWVFSAKNDFFLFIMPLFIGLVIVLGLEVLNFDASSLYNIGGVHIYARVTWIDWLFTALLDAPHAFSTGYRIFSDPLQLRKQWRLYLGLPIIVILTLIFAFRASELWTFRLITYLNIYHLIKQQYGWIRYSELKSNLISKLNPLLLKMMIFNLTLLPILLWHFNPNNQTRTGWIFQNDLLLFPSETIYTILLLGHWAFMGFFILSLIQHLRRGHSVSLGLLVVLCSTWMAWYGGIVLKIDGGGTVLIDILHIVPYLGLTFFVYKKQFFDIKKINFFSYYLPIAALGLIGTYLYSSFTPQNESPIALIVMAMLSGVSVTHYILDGFIWRRNQKNPAVEKWFDKGLDSKINSQPSGGVSIASGQ